MKTIIVMLLSVILSFNVKGQTVFNGIQVLPFPNSSLDIGQGWSLNRGKLQVEFRPSDIQLDNGTYYFKGETVNFNHTTKLKFESSLLSQIIPINIGGRSISSYSIKANNVSTRDLTTIDLPSRILSFFQAAKRIPFPDNFVLPYRVYFCDDIEIIFYDDRGVLIGTELPLAIRSNLGFDMGNEQYMRLYKRGTGLCFAFEGNEIKKEREGNSYLYKGNRISLHPFYDQARNELFVPNNYEVELSISSSLDNNSYFTALCKNIEVSNSPGIQMPDSILRVDVHVCQDKLVILKPTENNSATIRFLNWAHNGQPDWGLKLLQTPYVPQDDYVQLTATQSCQCNFFVRWRRR